MGKEKTYWLTIIPSEQIFSPRFMYIPEYINLIRLHGHLYSNLTYEKLTSFSPRENHNKLKLNIKNEKKL